MPEVIHWDRKAVYSYILEHGYEWARFKEPRGWKTLLQKQLGRLRNKCFRNSLYLALQSGGQLWYCEGFAGLSVKDGLDWYPHAWCSPKVFHAPDDSTTENEHWAFDVTWPWQPRRDVFDPESSMYMGIRMCPHEANDFLFDYLPKQGVTNISISVLKYLDYLQAFRLGLH